MRRFWRFLETIVIGSIGGMIFYRFQLPLPFILGSLTFITLWQGLMLRTFYLPAPVVDTGFIILGINFGLAFTLDTFRTVSMYILPFLIIVLIMLFFCVFIGLAIARKLAIDPVTSVFACIPGGLTEMTLASKALGANETHVAIFQTIRLLTVIFIVPFTLTRLFSVVGRTPLATEPVLVPSFTFTYLLYLIPACVGFFLKKRIPAGIIIGSLGTTALMNLTSLTLPEIPSYLVAMAQIAFGANLGMGITFSELKKAGRYGFYFLGAALVIVMFSMLCGALFALFTPLNLQTALLSTAPGGLFEMVVTATSVNGDPAIVSSLQLIRILLIVTIVPNVLKWYFTKYAYNHIENSTRGKT